jgi:hypothetical protein
MEPTERLSAAEYKELLAGGVKTTVGTRRQVRLPKGVRATKATRIATPLAILTRITRRIDISSLHLKPEERLAVDFADALRALTLEGRLRAVWTHPANEIAGRRSGLSRIRYAIAKRMGLVDGAADYLFLWSDGSGALEAKVGSNGLQPNQMDFQWWCERNGVRHRVFTTVEEGLAALREWGAILDEASPVVD